MRNPSWFTKENAGKAGSVGGRKSWEARIKGKTKKQIFEMMSRAKKGKKKGGNLTKPLSTGQV